MVRENHGNYDYGTKNHESLVFRKIEQENYCKEDNWNGIIVRLVLGMGTVHDIIIKRGKKNGGKKAESLIYNSLANEIDKYHT